MQNIPTLITLQEIYNNCITRSMLILADMLEQKKCNIDEKNAIRNSNGDRRFISIRTEICRKNKARKSKKYEGV